METPEITTNTTQKEIVCKGCGAKLKYAPGTNTLKCEHCGTANEIAVSQEAIEELDFETYINHYNDVAEKHDVVTVKCDACGAQTSFEANVVSGSCPFCGSPIVVSSGTIHRSIQPKSLLPFAIDKRRASEMYTNWLKSLWWAPNDLVKMATQDGKLVGMYIPYWTYDATTTTSYIGERGIDHTETEHYQDRDEKGNSVTRSRTVVRTIWYPASGVVNNVFDDILVVASQSLPRENTEKLEPWDLQNLVPFNPDFLSGYKTECYQTGLREGFDEARERMEGPIERTIMADIGGHHQRIFSKKTQYDNITFKHILLPIWISSYRYNDKVYRFMVNGRSGQVQGERPYSWVKITLAILGVITLAGLLILLV
jgi:LSD1 subclass zinc finger protein